MVTPGALLLDGTTYAGQDMALEGGTVTINASSEAKGNMTIV